MLNATVKTIIAAAAVALGLSACADKEAQGAAELYAQTEQALSERNFSGAITLLDTLNSRYPKQTEVRRNALQLRAKAIEGLTSDSIEAVSRRLAEATLAVQQLQPGFKYVKSTTGLDGYYIPSSASDKVMTDDSTAHHRERLLLHRGQRAGPRHRSDVARLHRRRLVDILVGHLVGASGQGRRLRVGVVQPGGPRRGRAVDTRPSPGIEGHHPRHQGRRYGQARRQAAHAAGQLLPLCLGPSGSAPRDRQAREVRAHARHGARPDSQSSQS